MSLQFLQSAVQNTNVKAFMLMIRKCEGTDAPDGYKYLFGSSIRNNIRFTDFSKHPDIKSPFRNTFSTAAGAYQILYHTWTTIQAKYNLPDFSPDSQDIACCELISGVNSLEALMHGDFNQALEKCATIWASLPSAKYDQPTHSIAQATDWYKEAGGQVA